MRRRPHRSRGYSLSELLTVVMLVGMISAIALPAFMQILPQYRIRSAASEMAASLRMLRARSVGTRSSWQMEIDNTNERYRMLDNNGNAIGENGRRVPSGYPELEYKKLTAIDVTGSGPVVFMRDGSVATQRTIVLAVNNTWVAYNRYTITVQTSGNVTITPSKV